LIASPAKGSGSDASSLESFSMASSETGLSGVPTGTRRVVEWSKATASRRTTCCRSPHNETNRPMLPIRWNPGAEQSGRSCNVDTQGRVLRAIGLSVAAVPR